MSTNKLVFSIFFIVITLIQVGHLMGYQPMNHTLPVPGTGTYSRFNIIHRNNGQWKQGERDCKNRGFVGLAQIKDRQEFDQLEELLKEYATTSSTYWVGAKYVPSARKFRWTTTKEFVGDWLDEVWESGYPGTFLNSQTALRLKYIRNIGWRFRTGVTSHNARYLCKA